MIENNNSYTERMCLSVMKRYTSEEAHWDYKDGLGLECIYRAGNAMDKHDWLDWVQAKYELFIKEDGTVKGYDFDEYSMDQISPGKVLFDLYDNTGDVRYKNLLDLFYKQLESQPRTPSGGFWHKGIYPNQMWLDGLYMQGSFYIRYAAKFGNLEACLKDLVQQFELIYTKTCDEKTGLLYHAWDESKEMAWSDPNTGLSKCVWARALGWYCMALLDVLDYVPLEKPFQEYRVRLIQLAMNLVKPLLDVQDPETGLWWQVMDRANEGKNYLESSGSAMFVYFLFKMARKGYLVDEEAKLAIIAGNKGFQGLIKEKIEVDHDGELHLTDICRGAGLGKYYPECPFRDGTFEYYTEREPIVTDNLQGTGPFILAALEAEYPELLR